jgi:hypothetical protein
MQVLFASEYYLTFALGLYLTCKVWDESNATSLSCVTLVSLQG